MSSVKVFCQGKAKRVSELRYTQGGTAVLSFSFVVATGQGENVHFDWYNASLFGNSAENLAGKIVEGTRFALVGRQKIETYTKADGTTGVSAKINVIDFEFAGEPPKKEEEVGSDDPGW